MSGLAQVRPLPYDAGADVANGIGCHLCASHTSYSWRTLLQHLRYKHNVKHSDVKGTPLHEMARAELRSQERSRHERKASRQRRRGSQQEQQQEQTQAPQEPAVWRQMQLWVQCDALGEPQMPLRCKLAQPRDVAIQEEQTLAFGEGDQGGGVTLGEKRKRADEEVEESQECGQRGAKQKKGCVGEQGQRGSKPRAAKLEERWARVAVAKQALEWAPKNKNARLLRTTWPLKPMIDFDTADFEAYLRNTLCLQESTVGAHIQKIKYFMGMLDVAYPSKHVDIMVGVYRSGADAAARSERPCVVREAPTAPREDSASCVCVCVCVRVCVVL